MMPDKQDVAEMPVDGEEFRVLIVEDLELFAQAIATELDRLGLAHDVVFTAKDALDMARRNDYHAILLDHRLPDGDGIKLIPSLLARQEQCSILVMTAYESISSAIEAIRLGADDYLIKETKVHCIVQRLVDLKRRREVRNQGTGWEDHRKEGLLGCSDAIAQVIEQLEKVSVGLQTGVLISGETGVGKEVAARMLHRLSAPAGSPFLSVDCVALPGNLMESLMFGHEKGAYTGAHETKTGLFQEAGKGTIFLDEIGDMEFALQGKLLRVLESRRFQRLGSSREVSVKARIVAATNKDLLKEVREGRFRQDLYQRLNVFPIHLPPLRERGGDILILARHFLAFFSGKMGVNIEPFSTGVEDKLMAYDYPGNVRELKNVLERAVIMSDSGRIDLEHLPERMLASKIYFDPIEPNATGNAIEFVPGRDSIKTLERELIQRALTQTDGAKAEAAKLLGISRFQLMRRLKKYNLR